MSNFKYIEVFDEEILNKILSDYQKPLIVEWGYNLFYMYEIFRDKETNESIVGTFFYDDNTERHFVLKKLIHE